jgi:hypothetical protein
MDIRYDFIRAIKNFLLWDEEAMIKFEKENPTKERK